MVEWSKAVHPPGLQRRAIRLPKIQASALAGQSNPDAGWIWLVHYLFDPVPPSWLPEALRSTLAQDTPKAGAAARVEAPPPTVLSSAAVPPPKLSQPPPLPVPGPSPTDRSGTSTEGDAYNFEEVESFVQLTEDELKNQVAAAEDLIRRSMALRMAGVPPPPVDSPPGDPVDSKHQACWTLVTCCHPRVCAGHSRTSSWSQVTHSSGHTSDIHSGQYVDSGSHSSDGDESEESDVRSYHEDGRVERCMLGGVCLMMPWYTRLRERGKLRNGRGGLR